MSNSVLVATRAKANGDLIDQLEALSQRTTVAALDAVLGILPQGGNSTAAAAAKMSMLSRHVVTAAQELEPTLAVGN